MRKRKALHDTRYLLWTARRTWLETVRTIRRIDALHSSSFNLNNYDVGWISIITSGLTSSSFKGAPLTLQVHTNTSSPSTGSSTVTKIRSPSQLNRLSAPHHDTNIPKIFTVIQTVRRRSWPLPGGVLQQQLLYSSAVFSSPTGSTRTSCTKRLKLGRTNARA